MTTTTPRPNVSSIPATQLLPGIHALRAVAALTILLFHLRYIADILPPPALQSTVGGHFFTGVILFFVLSAFSLAFSTTPTLSRPNWVRDYAIKRFFRIAPLFYCMMLMYVVLISWRGWAQPDLATWIMNITFLFNLVPGQHEGIVWASWTIGVEVLFYAIVPLLLLVSNRRIVMSLLLVVGIAVSIAARTLLDKAGLAGDYGKFAFLSSLGVFLTGFVSYKLYKLARRQILAGTWRPLSVKAVCAAVACLCLVGIFAPTGFNPGSVGRPDLMLWALLFAAISIWQALFPTAWFANSTLQWLGERSYGIYLLHPLVIGVLAPWFKHMYNVAQPAIGPWAFFVVGGLTMGLVIGLAQLAYLCIERPGMQLGKRLIGYLRAHPALTPTRDGVRAPVNGL